MSSIYDAEGAWVFIPLTK